MLRPGEVLQILNTLTGEVVTETSNPDAGIYLGKKRAKHPGGFVIVYEKDFREAALLLRGHGEIPLVLWNVLFTRIEIGTGEIHVNTVELAALLTTHRPNISKALKILKEIGLIAESRKEGCSTVYRINPSIMWKGKEKERQELLTVLQGGKK